MERIVRINLGDWSNEGHGKTSVVILKIRGEDVSDGRLLSSIIRAERETGVSLKEIFAEYEESSVEEETFKKLVRTFGDGLTELSDESVEDYYYAEIDGEYEEQSVVHLLTSFLGYGIPGFEYEIVDIPVLVGGYRSIVPSFGYGLFSLG